MCRDFHQILSARFLPNLSRKNHILYYGKNIQSLERKGMFRYRQYR